MTRTKRRKTAIKDALGDLFAFFRRRVEVYDVRVYARVLVAYSPTVIRAAVERAKQSRTFVPKPGELREDAEAVRRELLVASPYTPCDECGATGWVETVDAQSVKRMTRCACWHAWRDRLVTVGAERLPADSGPQATSGPAASEWIAAQMVAEQTRQQLKVVPGSAGKARRRTGG